MFNGMGNAGNMQGMMKKVQKMQAEMMKMQEELKTRTVETTVGGGALTIVANGKKEIESIKIKPEAIDPDDVEMLKSEPNLLQSYSNPMFYNILYILVFSFIGGIVGSGATALAMAFPNRFILYPLAFILWYISTAIKPSIIGALTPFTVYPLSHYTFTILFVVALNIVAVLFSFFKVTKYDQV